jgi:hypothetical protein
MVLCKFLSTRPRAVNLDDLVAPIPFSCQLSESLRRRNSLEQSRFSNSHCGEVVHRVFVLGLCFKSSESSKEVHPGSIEAFCYASLVSITNAKRGTLIFSHHVDSLDRWAPSLLVSRPYDAMTSLYHRFLQSYSQRRSLTGWPLSSSMFPHQIPNWVNWPLQSRSEYKREPFYPKPPMRKLHFHPSSALSLFLFFF